MSQNLAKQISSPTNLAIREDRPLADSGEMMES